MVGWQGLSNPSPLLLGLAERAAEASKRRGDERGWRSFCHGENGLLKSCSFASGAQIGTKC